MVLNWDRLYKSCGSVCGEDKIRGYLTIELIIEGSLAASPQCSRRVVPVALLVSALPFKKELLWASDSQDG